MTRELTEKKERKGTFVLKEIQRDERRREPLQQHIGHRLGIGLAWRPLPTERITHYSLKIFSTSGK